MDEQVALKNLRESTARVAYKNRLATWAYPHIGDVPWNVLAREQIGAVLLGDPQGRGSQRRASSKSDARSLASTSGRSNVHRYDGPNPAANLKFFLGKQPSKKRRRRDLQWFRPEEAQRLLEACQTLKPRWVVFLMVCFGGGLRWGETTALVRADLDWRRERSPDAQRTWSEDGGRIELCKDAEDRWVNLPTVTMAALCAHLEAMDLEATVRAWSPAQRQLVFPNTVGRVTRYGTFLELVWQPLVATTKLPYRKPHAMRHSYATWLLEGGADLPVGPGPA